MKKIVFIFVIFFCSIISFAETDIKEYIKDKEIYFSIINIRNKSVGNIYIEDGNITCGFGGEYLVCLFKDVIFHEDYMTVFFERSAIKKIFSVNGNIVRDFYFPLLHSVEISFDDLRIAWEKDVFYDLKYDETISYPTTCQAIVIDNINIRDKPASNGNKIGRLEKRTEVTLYEESENIDEIDGEKNPWYKVKLDEDVYGWVYGGYIRIFFDNPELGYSDKELILKSIE